MPVAIGVTVDKKVSGTNLLRCHFFAKSAPPSSHSAIFPGHLAPIVRQSADGEREIVLMSREFVVRKMDRALRRFQT